jgi:hypothetical protein
MKVAQRIFETVPPLSLAMLTALANHDPESFPVLSRQKNAHHFLLELHQAAESA